MLIMSAAYRASWHIRWLFACSAGVLWHLPSESATVSMLYLDTDNAMYWRLVWNKLNKPHRCSFHFKILLKVFVPTYESGPCVLGVWE